MKNYTTKSPVLFLIFNRPHTTQLVFNAIRDAKPSKLYIAADGPRKDRNNEAVLCRAVLEIVAHIDWECTVEKLIRTENLGCKDAISSAVTWFFDHEEEGIILEDDCLPSSSFFFYCDTLLEKYRNDDRVRHIAGFNDHMGKRWGNATTFFTNQSHVWGWASWRRVWKDYDKDLLKYDENEVGPMLAKIFSDMFVVEMLTEIFKLVKNNKIKTWDYQLAFMNLFQNGLAINPNVNLITNIGFGADATHAVNTNDRLADVARAEITEITYPIYMLAEKEADFKTFEASFNIKEKWRKHNKLKRRVKRYLKSIF